MRLIRRALTAITLVVPIVVMAGSGIASAHHADIALTTDCTGRVSYVVTDWKTTNPGATNPSVEVRYLGAVIQTGAFKPPVVTFSGSFHPTAVADNVVTLTAITTAAWDDGTPAGDNRSASITILAPCPTTTTSTTKPPVTTTTSTTVKPVVTTTTTIGPTTTTTPVVTTVPPVTTTDVPDTTTTTKPIAGLAVTGGKTQTPLALAAGLFIIGLVAMMLVYGRKPA